jgi:hypothetical protein
VGTDLIDQHPSEARVLRRFLVETTKRRDARDDLAQQRRNDDSAALLAGGIGQRGIDVERVEHRASVETLGVFHVPGNPDRGAWRDGPRSHRGFDLEGSVDRQRELMPGVTVARHRHGPIYRELFGGDDSQYRIVPLFIYL